MPAPDERSRALARLSGAAVRLEPIVHQLCNHAEAAGLEFSRDAWAIQEALDLLRWRLHEEVLASAIRVAKG